MSGMGMKKIKKGVTLLFTKPGTVFFYLFRSTVSRCLPTSVYLKIVNRVLLKKKLNLKNPKTFNDKLQWLKIHDRNPNYVRMVDKYEAKKYVAEYIGEEYVIPTLGVWDSFDEIDFDQLPDRFVLKCTHDSGGLVICRNKNELDLKQAKSKINMSLKNNYYWNAREWPYKNVVPRIIAEQYMESDGDEELIDYKFFCFNGEPRFLYVSHGLARHETATIDFYDLNYQRMPFKRTDYKSSAIDAQKPKTFENMVSLAKKLSQGIPFVRVDLYEINGKNYFSEITFFPCAGWMPFDPPEWDSILGDYIDIQGVK